MTMTVRLDPSRPSRATRRCAVALALATVTLSGIIQMATRPASAQQGASTEWRAYGGQPEGTKYSPLDQIDAGNVNDLRIAWRWRSVDYDLVDDNPDLRFNHTLLGTPLKVGDQLLMSTNLGQAAGIDPATGETLWSYRALDDGAGRPRGGSTRGVGYWHDPGLDDERIFLVSGERLVAIDAKTGNPIREFGEGGKVNLRDGIPRLEEYQWNAPPLVCRDTVIVGIYVNDVPMNKEQPPGYIRGFDAVTGRLKWQFNPIPQPGELGHDTWEDGSWEYTGSATVWSVMTADDDLGYAYLPTGTPTHNWYGGHRPGDNLFAESLLCLECDTGQLVWYHQLIHHGIWDYDIASPPILADITVEGRAIRAVVQVTKQAFAFVFDRVTGEPVWPIEERPVSSSDVPGEQTSPTQPFPTKPAAFDRQGITVDDLIDFTPELRVEAVEIFDKYRSGPIFTPPSVRDESPGGTLGTLQLPSYVGGSNWNGAAYDPETQMLYVPSITAPILVAPTPPWGGSDSRTRLCRISDTSAEIGTCTSTAHEACPLSNRRGVESPLSISTPVSTSGWCPTDPDHVTTSPCRTLSFRGSVHRVGPPPCSRRRCCFLATDRPRWSSCRHTAVERCSGPMTSDPVGCSGKPSYPPARPVHP